MSVVIRDNGKLKMYMKGADSIVQRRLSKNNKLGLSMELEKFSVIGLRTLLIAMKTLSE
jgi:phospholipid-transporting ATPase